jgi:hypothetical protein
MRVGLYSLIASGSGSFAALVTVPAEPPNAPFAIPYQSLNTDYVILGKLQRPLGTVTTVQGVAVESWFRAYLGVPMLRVQRIGGEAVVSHIEIPLTPDLVNPKEGPASPRFELGRTYELVGYETGGFEGIPGRAFDEGELVIATTDHHFACRFVILRGAPIDPVRFTPADFVGRETLLSGRAKSRDGKAWIAGDGWELLVDAAAPWGVDLEGKETEAHGVIGVDQEAGVHRLESGRTRLVRLEDQVGREVELRGVAWSLNGHWWLKYRGTALHVEGLAEMLEGTDRHASRILIRGRLERDMLPRIDQITLRPDRDLAEGYIVRSATWEPLNVLLSPEHRDRGGR